MNEQVKLGNADGANGWAASAGVYHKLYGGIPANVAKWIEDDIVRIHDITRKKSITLLDYGCGTGRYFPLYEQIAKKHGLHITCLAFDPVLAQLEEAEKLLTGAKNAGNPSLKAKRAFTKTEGSPSLEERKNDLGKGQCSAGFRGPKYHKTVGKGSLTVEFIHGNIDPSCGETYDPEYLKNTLFKNDTIDYGLCLFGVLSYIMGEKNRVAMLQTLGDMVSGPMRVSIPTQHRDKTLYDGFESKRACLELARKNKNTSLIAEMEAELGCAREHGETLTPFPAAGGKTVLHPYYYVKDTGEFGELLNKAGFQDYEISTSNIWSEAYTTKKPFRSVVDAINSASLTAKEMNKRAMFLMARIQGKKAIEVGFPALTETPVKKLPYSVIRPDSVKSEPVQKGVTKAL